MNIIAGVSNRNEVFYTINSGKTTSNTFLFYLIKLCEYLDSQDPQWRVDTIIMLDNAQYHRGVFITEKMSRLRIPILYLGPYHFKLAPIEMFFNYIKNRDINPLNSNVIAM